MNAPKRRAVPMRAQRDLALAQLADLMRKLGMVACEMEVVWQLDHDPALGLRPINAARTDWEPPQHEARCLVWRPQVQHALKTTGRRGESDLSLSFNGDTSRAAKVKRIEAEQAEARARMLAKAPGERPPLKGTIARRVRPDRQPQGTASRPSTKPCLSFPRQEPSNV